MKHGLFSYFCCIVSYRRVSRHPILLFVYLSQYAPTIAHKLAGRVADSRVNAFRNGNRDINAGISLRTILGLRK